MTDPVIFARRGATATITLNRPEALNALSPALMEALEAVLDRLGRDDTLRAVVLTGAGRAFSAGGDLKTFLETAREKPPAALTALIAFNQTVLRKLERLPMPVIAAVNGIAAAGGLELMLCCDLIVAAEGAMIGDGHARYGIIPAGGASVRLRERLPRARVAELFFTGDLYPARTLADWGLVNAVVPADRLAGEAADLADRLSSRSPQTLRRMKALMDGAPGDRDAAFDAEVDSFAAHAQDHDFKEGLAAFVGKREPVF